MLTQRELQDKILTMLPTYRRELQKMENRLITCGAVDRHFVSESFTRVGIHIFGEASEGHNAPIDYLPHDHQLYIIRAEVSPVSDGDAFMIKGKGNESCPLCGKPIPVQLKEALVPQDLVLVGCPVLKEGEIVIDVLPIFSPTLVKDAISVCLNLPHQRSKNPMTRVSRLL